MEGRDRVESLSGLEVAAAQEKDQLIARRAQALAMSWSGVGKSKQRLRSTLLKTGGKSNTSRSTLLRIFMRGMGGSLSFLKNQPEWPTCVEDSVSFCVLLQLPQVLAASKIGEPFIARVRAPGFSRSPNTLLKYFKNFNVTKR